MDITKEMILGFSADQAKALHEKIAAFIDRNYADFLDAGLMDDILVNEYKAGVAKLSCCNNSTKETLAGLSTILWQVVECASECLAEGRKDSVYKDVIGIVAEAIGLVG